MPCPPFLRPAAEKMLGVLGFSILLGSGAIQAAVVIDFETAGQLAANFRVLTGSSALASTSNGAANDYVTTTTGTSSIVYDANGTTAGQSPFTVSQAAPLTISAQMRFNTSGNSFGIHIIDPTDETKGYLALFNVNFSGSNDQFRFSSSANPTTAAAGTLVTGSFLNNADVGITNNSVFNTITLTYSINGSNNPVLSLTAGSQTSTITFSAITTPLTNVEVGFRSFAGGVVGLDNISIIPEPSTASAAFLGLGLLALRRRVRR